MNSYPFYLILQGGQWAVVPSPGRKEITHTTLWQVLVHKLVAKEYGMALKRLFKLTFCQFRGQFVHRCSIKGYEDQNVLLLGEKLSQRQEEAIRLIYGQLPVIIDGSLARSKTDIARLNSLTK